MNWARWATQELQGSIIQCQYCKRGYDFTDALEHECYDEKDDWMTLGEVSILSICPYCRRGTTTTLKISSENGEGSEGNRRNTLPQSAHLSDIPRAAKNDDLLKNLDWKASDGLSVIKIHRLRISCDVCGQEFDSTVQVENKRTHEQLQVDRVCAGRLFSSMNKQTADDNSAREQGEKQTSISRRGAKRPDHEPVYPIYSRGSTAWVDDATYWSMNKRERRELQRRRDACNSERSSHGREMTVVDAIFNPWMIPFALIANLFKKD